MSKFDSLNSQEVVELVQKFQAVLETKHDKLGGCMTFYSERLIVCIQNQVDDVTPSAISLHLARGNNELIEVVSLKTFYPVGCFSTGTIESYGEYIKFFPTFNFLEILDNELARRGLTLP
jgi:hypothetical protein